MRRWLVPWLWLAACLPVSSVVASDATTPGLSIPSTYEEVDEGVRGWFEGVSQYPQSNTLNYSSDISAREADRALVRYHLLQNCLAHMSYQLVDLADNETDAPLPMRPRISRDVANSEVNTYDIQLLGPMISSSLIRPVDDKWYSVYLKLYVALVEPDKYLYIVKFDHAKRAVGPPSEQPPDRRFEPADGLDAAWIEGQMQELRSRVADCGRKGEVPGFTEFLE